MSQIHSTDAAGLTTLSLFPGLFCIAKKESLAKHLNLHWGNPATVFVWSQAATSRGAL